MVSEFSGMYRSGPLSNGIQEKMAESCFQIRAGNGRIAGFWCRGLFHFLISMLVLSMLLFGMSRLAPGDPLVSWYGERVQKMSAEERMQAEARLGLNEPIPVQYVRWLKNALNGEFGISYKYKTDALLVIRERAGNTLLLGGTAFLLTAVLSILLGVFCASRENRLSDRLICRLGTVLDCVPQFWLSLLLIFWFSVTLRWLPASGAYSAGKEADTPDRLRHLILPLTVAVLSHLWYYAYMIRNLMTEELKADYVLWARARGVGRRRILFRYCLMNILPSYLSILAVSMPHLVGGTYLIEVVFSYPGLGTLAYESVRYQDYNLLMLTGMLSGGAVLLADAAGRWFGGRINPKLRQNGAWDGNG